MYPGEFSHGYGYVIGECGLVENITPSTTALRASRVSSEYGSYYTYVNIFAPLYEEKLVDIPCIVTIFVEEINFTYTTEILFSTNMTNIIYFKSETFYHYLEEYYELGGLTGWIHVTVESK